MIAAREDASVFPADQPASDSPGRIQMTAGTVNGVVLCGGESRRMGRDKAQLELGGITLVERAVRVLEPVCAEVLLATGAAPRYEHLQRRVVLDALSDGGPLAGLCAALEEIGGGLACCLACDMPHAQTSHFKTLVARMVDEQLDLCMLSTLGRREPLFAVYRHTCLAPMRAALTAGERRVVSFHGYAKADGQALSIGELEVSRVAGFESSCTFNVNTPDEYTDALSSSLEKN